MEELDDVPLPSRPLRVAVICNLKQGNNSGIPDDEAEYDSVSTMDAIVGALRNGGYDAYPLPADKRIAEKLDSDRPDIVFNIAEGFRGRGREAQIPAILNMLGIPFTGSDETTLCVCLDKALTKKVLDGSGVRTAFSVVLKDNEPLDDDIEYPVIIKPRCEGSSKGINDLCIAHDSRELYSLASEKMRVYGCDLLAEEFLPGREFTVGLLGNGRDAFAFSPMEIIYRSSETKIYSYGVKQNYTEFIDYKCLGSEEEALASELKELALSAAKTLECRDFARVDFRLDSKNRPCFIEINPLPGLAPGYSDYPMLAGFCGTNYQKLVCSVLEAGIKRIFGRGGAAE